MSNAEYPGIANSKAGTWENTFQDMVIYCPPPSPWTQCGIFIDAGNFGNKIRRIHFWGPGNAIYLPNNLLDPTKPNTVDLASCIFENSGAQVLYHDDAIG
jgi:hypothetical protein